MVTSCGELARNETLGVTKSDPAVAERYSALCKKHDPFHIRRCDHVRIISVEESSLKGGIVTNKASIPLQECTDPKFLQDIH